MLVGKTVTVADTFCAIAVPLVCEIALVAFALDVFAHIDRAAATPESACHGDGSGERGGSADKSGDDSGDGPLGGCDSAACNCGWGLVD